MFYDESIPDDIRNAVIRAKETWESKLKNKYPIYVNIDYAEYIEDVAVITDVFLSESAPVQSMALRAQITERVEDSTDNPDAVITINPNVEWDCCYDGSSKTEKQNLYSAMLRAFASCIGFGSSVVMDGLTGEVELSDIDKRTSDFDELIFSANGLKLKDYADDSVNLKQFCEGKLGSPIYVLTRDSDHTLYVPSNFTECVSMRYLNNVSSLMHYDIGRGDKRLAIDDVTVEVLNALGWNIFSADAVKIVCDDIAEDGIGSAYKSHTFSLDGCDGVPIGDPRWTFSVCDENGTPVLVQSGTNTTFMVESLQNPDSYPLNGNGDIRGEVTFEGKLDGEPCVRKFTVFLEVRPRIYTPSEPQFVYKENSFDVYVSVPYVGSDYIIALAEEDYNPIVRRFRFDQPYLANVVIKDVSYHFYSWIDLVVENQYGSDRYSIEIEPQAKQNAIVLSEGDIMECVACGVSELYTIQGVKVGTDDVSSLSKGVYIRKTTDSNGHVEIKKIIVK